MTTDWKALCAQLAENVRYLLDCVADGDSDPVAIAECVQHLGATRAALSQPEPEEPASTMSASERWAVLSWVEDHIDTNKALRSWRDSTRGGLLMAEVHTVQPGVRARLAQADSNYPAKPDSSTL